MVTDMERRLGSWPRSWVTTNKRPSGFPEENYRETGIDGLGHRIGGDNDRDRWVRLTARINKMEPGLNGTSMGPLTIRGI